MLFNALNDAADRGELIMRDGAICHYHLRRDGQLTIREILVLPNRRGEGLGAAILAELRSTPGATHIVAKCPASLPANDWYPRRGFIEVRREQTRSGSEVVVWRLDLV